MSIFDNKKELTDQLDIIKDRAGVVNYYIYTRDNGGSMEEMMRSTDLLVESVKYFLKTNHPDMYDPENIIIAEILDLPLDPVVMVNIKNKKIMNSIIMKLNIPLHIFIK